VPVKVYTFHFFVTSNKRTKIMQNTKANIIRNMFSKKCTETYILAINLTV